MFSLDIFRQAESPESGNVFVRDTPETERAVQYHIAEIREREYDDEEELMRGTFRGEVEFLPRVPLWGLQALQDDPEWTVRRYHLPEVHLLQFHPDSRPASSQELRRAIYFALDRPTILRDVVLAGADPALGQPTSAPFPRQLYAYQLGVREGEHDLRVALSLALTSLREGEQSLPALRLVCEPDPAMHAPREMIRLWKRIGLEVELVEPDQPAEQWTSPIAALRWTNRSLNCGRY